MKRNICILLLVFFAIAAKAQKDVALSSQRHLPGGKDFDITSMGRTSALNEKYHIKASIDYVSKTGYILKFSSDAPVAKAIMKKWMNNTQGKYDTQ
jgi:hypothetical protein